MLQTRSLMVVVWCRNAWRDRFAPRLYGVLARHGLALGALTLVIAFAQLTLIATHPQVPGGPDSGQYLLGAAAITAHGRFVDPLRTPGYPLFLALIFRFTGGQEFGSQNIAAAIGAQIALMIVTCYEIYVLAYRITPRPLFACLAAALVSLNVYILDWEYSIRNEALTMWILVTLALVARTLLKRARFGALVWFTALSLFLVLVRPFYIFLPALLVGALLLRALWQARLRRSLYQYGAALVVVYGLIVGYMALNQVYNGFFGLSYVSGVNLFGKVLEFHLEDLAVSADLAPIQRDLLAYTASGGADPWTFGQQYGYERNYYVPLGTYANYVVLHHPAQFAPPALKDSAVFALTNPALYAQGSPTRLFEGLRLLSRLLLLAYALTPAAVIWLSLRLWRDRNNRAIFTLCLLTLLILGALLMEGASAYDEFYRLRSPVDWAIFVVLALVGADMWESARRRRSARLPKPAL